MRWIRFAADGVTAYGKLDGDIVHELTGAPWDQGSPTGKKYALSQVRLLAPAVPSKIVCLGLNYAEHAAEGGHGTAPGTPLIFLKPPTSVIGPEDTIVWPAMSEKIGYEAELTIVMGRKAKDVSEAAAGDYVFGWTCAHDVSARDIQKSDGQWVRAKSFDTFCPLGPWIEDSISVSDVKAGLAIRGYLNGEKKQDGTTADLVHQVDQLVSFVSQVMTLLPGDIILTGTPAGVGLMQPGDVYEVEIERLGKLRNTLNKAQ